MSGGTAEQKSECMGHGGWAVSSSCGGRELLRAGVPERCRPAGSERWRHLEEGTLKGGSLPPALMVEMFTGTSILWCH